MDIGAALSDNIDLGGGVLLKSKEKTGTQVQWSGLDVGSGTTHTPAVSPSTDLAALPVVNRFQRSRLTATSTITNGGIYAAKDALGGIWTFANAARFSGGGGRLRAITIYDLGQQLAALDLVLFSASPAGTVTDNAPFDPSDADLDTVQYLGSIAATTGWKDFTDNAAAQIACDVPYACAATSLFGVLVARGTPTYTSTSDIKIALHVELD